MLRGHCFADELVKSAAMDFEMKDVAFQGLDIFVLEEDLIVQIEDFGAEFLARRGGLGCGGSCQSTHERTKLL